MKRLPVISIMVLLTLAFPKFLQAGPDEAIAPQRAIVQRARDAAVRERLWIAVQEAAAARGIALPTGLDAKTLQWAPSESMLTPNSSLVVQSVRQDLLLNELWVRLGVSTRPSAPSFYAWCRLAIEPSLYRQEGLAELSLSKDDISRPPDSSLVSVRRVAILHLHSQNSSGSLSVRPLQSGQLGEVVRVRVIGNGHTLVARVAGPDLLDATF
jgi:hypothetical protein